MAEISWEKQADDLERLIRDGHGRTADKKLSALPARRMPRELLARYGELARRAGIPLLAIRWLGPFVRPAPRRPATASQAEIVEYAAALIRVGATDEALKLLEPIDQRRYPRAGFERAAALVAQWRYGESIPHLQAYIEHPRTRSYDRLVGKVNLSAALVHECHFRKAEVLLRELLHETSVRRLPLLLGNVFQFSALCFLSQRKMSDAARFLDRATASLPDPRLLDAFFVRKWRAFLLLLDKGDQPAGLEAVEKVRQEAEHLGHWETCRDCDRYRAMVTQDRKLILRVYFGTPYPAFRERFLEDLGRPARVPSEYLWETGHGARQVLDVQHGRVENGDESAEMQGRLHRLLLVLSSDFYRPFRVASLFQSLYPGEFFHPTASAGRVYQAVRALRHWADDHKVGVEIRESSGAYRLSVTEPWALRLSLERDASHADRRLGMLKKLREKFPKGTFNALEAAEKLGVSRRGVLRVLALGQEEKWIERTGKRAAAKYHFVK